MIAYLFPISVAMLLSILAPDKKLPVQKFIPFIFIVLVMFVGLRYASVDYFNYEAIFNYVSNYDDLGFPNYTPETGEKPTESLYSLLTLLIKKLGGSFGSFVFLIALLSVGIKVYAFKKMSNFFYLSLLLYVAMCMGKDLGQIRNGLASALVLFSVYYVYEKRFIKFNLIALSAMLIHLMGALSFLVYYLRLFNKPILMGAVLFLSLMMAAYGGLGIKVVDILTNFAGLNKEFRLVRYMDSKYSENYSLFGGTILMHLFFSIVSLVSYRKLTQVNKYNSIIVPMYIYGFSMMLFFADYGIILARIKDLFTVPASMILIPSLVLLFKPNSRPFIYMLVVFYALLMFYFNIPSAPYEIILFR